MPLYVLRLATGRYYHPPRRDIMAPRWRQNPLRTIPRTKKKIIARGYITQKAKTSGMPEWLEKAPQWFRLFTGIFFERTVTYVLVDTLLHRDIFIIVSPKVYEVLEEGDTIPIQYSPKSNGQHRGKIAR